MYIYTHTHTYTYTHIYTERPGLDEPLGFMLQIAVRHSGWTPSSLGKYASRQKPNALS